MDGKVSLCFCLEQKESLSWLKAHQVPELKVAGVTLSDPHQQEAGFWCIYWRKTEGWIASCPLFFGFFCAIACKHSHIYVNWRFFFYSLQLCMLRQRVLCTVLVTFLVVQAWFRAWTTVILRSVWICSFCNWCAVNETVIWWDFDMKFSNFLLQQCHSSEFMRRMGLYCLGQK